MELEIIQEKCQVYRNLVDSGQVEKADFWHFCGYLGMDEETVLRLTRSKARKDQDIGRELRRMVTWIKGQYATAPGWNGSNGTKALFLLKQDIGGIRLTDKPEDRQDRSREIKVCFGGKLEDPFG